MNKKHKSNLARTALKMLNSEIPIDMRDFLTNPKYVRGYAWSYCPYNRQMYNECGTSACFLGFGPLALGSGPEKGDWNSFSKKRYGLEPYEDAEWLFLFDNEWPNSKKQAAARAVIVMRDGVPKDWSYDSVYLKRWSIDQIKDQLLEYV